MGCVKAFLVASRDYPQLAGKRFAGWLILTTTKVNFPPIKMMLRGFEVESELVYERELVLAFLFSDSCWLTETCGADVESASAAVRAAVPFAHVQLTHLQKIAARHLELHRLRRAEV
jgi:hypothetical protein